MNDTTNTTTTTPKYYPINEAMARKAKRMMSYDEYREGTATENYRRMVDSAAELAERCKAGTDPMYHEKIDNLLDTYARKLAENLNQHYSIMSQCPSILVAGGSNFPVRKKERQNAADEWNMEEYHKIQGLLGKMRSVGKGGISADDPNAVEKLRRKLESLERSQENMKAANAAIRMKDTAKGDAKLAELGFSQADIRALRTPDFAGRVGFPDYQLRNNNANIRRLRERLEELEKRAADPAPDGWTFEGGEVVINTELNRLQIVLEGRPDADMKQALKSHGFRWAPSQGAWQRQYTESALLAAKEITRKGVRA